MANERHAVRFPGESTEYRTARNALLEAEIDLRRQLENVAAQRRKLPLGGLAQDYVFEEGSKDPSDQTTVHKLHLADLFQGGMDTLILYSFMFGPEMQSACPSCSAMIDGLNGTAPHAQQRVNLAVVAKSPLARIRQFAQRRGWRNVRLLSSAGTTYNADYRGENEKGEQIPMLNVFVRRDDGVHHFYGAEVMFAPPEPGQDSRHVDLICPFWNLFDLTPEGRGVDWHPRLSYEPPTAPIALRTR
jgi:predicted dithiol-disulfide oxidoreductase (DUF899 family)